MARREREIHNDVDCDATRTLLIIGNGFDLCHDLATKYSDYRNWLLDHDKHVVTEFELDDYVTECPNRVSSLGCKTGSNDEHDHRWSSLEESLGIEWDDLCYETLEHTYPDLTEDNPG